MKLERLNPFVRYAKEHEFYTKRDEDSICYDSRLFYIMKGSGTLTVNGEQHVISQNHMIYLPPVTRYRFEFADPASVKIYVINFDLTEENSSFQHSIGTATVSTFDERKVLKTSIDGLFSSHIILKDMLHLRCRIAECVDLFTKKAANYQHYASANIKMLLIGLLDECRNEKSDFRLIKSVLDYIHSNYQNPALSNATIAKEFNYHPYYLSRLMKENTDKTLRDYVNDYRLHMAKIYLTTTNLNITEIANKTGFSSYTYFIKLFRERTGEPPLKYRNARRNFGI